MVRGYRESKSEQHRDRLNRSFLDTDGFKLILVTDRHRVGKERLIEVIAGCLEAGLHAVMLREKDLPGKELLDMAVALRKITSDHGAALILNDRADVAIAADADAVHVGSDSFKPCDLKAHLPAGMIVGASAHNLREAIDRKESGADYIMLSPVFATTSKPGAIPLGVDVVKEVVNAVEAPVFALGGVTALRVPQILEAGVKGVAVISAILDYPDPAQAVKMLIKSLERASYDSTGSGNKR